jgi:hypothetical protein
MSDKTIDISDLEVYTDSPQIKQNVVIEQYELANIQLKRINRPQTQFVSPRIATPQPVQQAVTQQPVERVGNAVSKFVLGFQKGVLSSQNIIRTTQHQFQINQKESADALKKAMSGFKPKKSGKK